MDRGSEVGAVRGDCFQAALGISEVMWAQGIEAFVAHGMPIGRGPENNGVRYWHGWCEAKLPGRGWYVLEASNGQRLAIKRTDYYRAGKINPEEVRRFGPDETEREKEDRGHFGPWVDNFEEMAL